MERVIMEGVIIMMERSKEMGDPLTEEDAFDLTIEQLEESLSYYTLKECKDVVGEIDY